MKQEFLAKPIQQQKISQKQIQSLHLLMMNNEELSRFLQNEYLENPMLENSGQIPPCFPTRGAVKAPDEPASYSPWIRIFYFVIFWSSLIRSRIPI